jgi:hypothetical protein
MLSRIEIDTTNQEQVENLKVSLIQAKGRPTRSSIISDDDIKEKEEEEEEDVLLFRGRKRSSYTSAGTETQ